MNGDNLKRESAMLSVAILITILQVILITSCAESSQLQPQSDIELRLASQQPIAGAKPVDLPDFGGPIYLTNEKVTVLKDEIAKISVKSDHLGSQVIVKLNKSGAAKLSIITAKGYQKTLAILVSGNIVHAAKVREKIPGGTMAISGFKTTSDAFKMARRIAGRLES
jgi:preprotein translocase subunit SecD